MLPITSVPQTPEFVKGVINLRGKFTHKCRQSIRGEDFLARYGGEEFVIILPGASLKNAIKRAEAICKSIASTRYYLDDVAGNPTLSVTVSIGVSSYQKADTTATVTQEPIKPFSRTNITAKTVCSPKKACHKIRKKLPDITMESVFFSGLLRTIESATDTVRPNTLKSN